MISDILGEKCNWLEVLGGPLQQSHPVGDHCHRIPRGFYLDVETISRALCGTPQGSVISTVR